MTGMFPDVDTAFIFFSCTYLMLAATTICTFQGCIDLGIPRPLLVAWIVGCILGALSSFLLRTSYLAWAKVLDKWHDRCIRGTAYASIFVLLDICCGDVLPAFLRTMFGVVLFGCVVWWEGSAAWTAVTTWLAEKRKQQRLERKAEAARRRKQVKRDRVAAEQAAREQKRLEREAAEEAVRAARDAEAAADAVARAREQERAAQAVPEEKSEESPAAPRGYEIVARVLHQLGEAQEVLPLLLRGEAEDAFIPTMYPAELIGLGVSRTTAEKIIAAVSESMATAAPRGKVLVDEILDDAAARQSELETSLTARQAEVARLKEILKAQHREIPDAYLCPITMDPMEDPVIAADGHSYEKSEINAWFARGNNTSPKTGAQLEDTRLFPNHNLRNAIQNFLAEVRQFDCEL